MEWSKEKTLKLVELLQVSAPLWNPAVCESRRDKQKRKEELRNIAKVLDISLADVTKKIQHLRTQYNREAAREARVKTDDPNDRYVSNWYAFEYLHFLKDTTKPFRLLGNPDEYVEELANVVLQNGEISITDTKLVGRSPPRKIQRTELHSAHSPKSEYLTPQKQHRDEFSVFGEYVANELRSLKGEKNLLVAKKKIQDAIFDVKIGSIHEPPPLQPAQTVETLHHQHHQQNMHNGKLFSPPTMSGGGQAENLAHPPPGNNMSEITNMITNCHYGNFKVDQQ